jgi:hypothetical protein
MCRTYIYVPSYADHHPEHVPNNQPWDDLEFQLQKIEEHFDRRNSPHEVKITEPAKFLLSLQYLIGVQLHANKMALPPRYNPATYPETKSMITALCEYMNETMESNDIEDLLYTLCCHILEKIGTDNGIPWSRYIWILNSISDEWLSWAIRTLRRALWMATVWTLGDWPLTDAYHCLAIKMVVNLRYPYLQQKMEELDTAFTRGVGSLEQGCGTLDLYLVD